MIAEEFTRASESVKRLNPHLFGAPAAPGAPNPTTAAVSIAGAPRRGQMNKTESEFALHLECFKQKGEIVRYEFEGITLRWAGMRYTPDFVVFRRAAQALLFVEVKGGHIWDRDLVRFKGARAYWPQFHFEMHQKVQGAWRQIY